MQGDSIAAKVSRTRAQDATGLVFWLFLSLVVAMTGRFFQPGDWYLVLQKPSWTPPGWVFGPVWTLLYIAMAVAAWMVWRSGPLARTKRALAAYLVQLALNAAWSWIFFGLHQLGWAAVEIVILLTAIAITIVMFRRHRPAAALLMTPYLVWVGYASALNIQIWRLN